MRHGIQIVAWVLLALVQISVGACGTTNKQINPGTAQVDLYVWRVFADSTDQPGYTSNIGCRLTDDEIIAIVNQLRKNAAALYGYNTTFTWDGVVHDFMNGYEQSAPEFVATLQAWIDQEPTVRWKNDKINIYFVGNYIDGSGGSPYLFGANLDPLAHAPAIGWRKLIFMNDCRFILLADPATNIRAFHILEHEMAHYLARFQLRYFGPVGPAGRFYDSGEHTTTPNNLLAPGITDANVGPPFPLIIPGSELYGLTEKGEIWARVYAGLWNSASNP